MKGKGPFDPREEAPLLSAYVDGELDRDDVTRIEEHLATNEDTRREVAELRRLKNLAGTMRLKEPDPEEWEAFWRNVYNRVERSLGWISLAAGVVLVAAWAALQLLTALLDADTLPLYVKIGVFVGAAGLLVLLISVIRERIYKRARTRYKDVVR